MIGLMDYVEICRAFLPGASIPLGSWSKILPAVGPFSPFPLSSLSPPVLSLCTSFRGTNTLIPSHLLPSLPCPCKQGSGVSPWKNFLKCRWLWVKFGAFWGKIWQLNRRTVSGADSLKIGIFWNYRPIWICWVSGDEQWPLRWWLLLDKVQGNIHMADFFLNCSL